MQIDRQRYKGSIICVITTLIIVDNEPMQRSATCLVYELVCLNYPMPLTVVRPSVTITTLPRILMAHSDHSQNIILA